MGWLRLQERRNRLINENASSKLPKTAQSTVASTVAAPDKQQVLYLWEEGNVPAVTEYTQMA